MPPRPISRDDAVGTEPLLWGRGRFRAEVRERGADNRLQLAGVARVRLEQRPHQRPQLVVAGRLSRDEVPPLRRRPVEGPLEQRLHDGPAFGRHDGWPPAMLTRSHALARRSSRSTVAAETPIASAVSS